MHSANINIDYKEHISSSGPEVDCFGRDCKNLGINYLKILLVKEYGWFCESCTSELIKLELVKQ